MYGEWHGQCHGKVICQGIQLKLLLNLNFPAEVGTRTFGPTKSEAHDEMKVMLFTLLDTSWTQRYRCRWSPLYHARCSPTFTRALNLHLTLFHLWQKTRCSTQPVEDIVACLFFWGDVVLTRHVQGLLGTGGWGSLEGCLSLVSEAMIRIFIRLV
jgi:hypothetical protein